MTAERDILRGGDPCPIVLATFIAPLLDRHFQEATGSATHEARAQLVVNHSRVRNEDIIVWSKPSTLVFGIGISPPARVLDLELRHFGSMRIRTIFVNRNLTMESAT